VLKPNGSFVLDLGGAYQSGRPVRSLYNFRIMLRLCDEYGFRLAEEFFWHNPAKLPSPIEWVNKRKIRAKDSVNTVWWLAKTDFPKADVRRVLAPYSDRMKKLLEDAESFYRPKLRPSGHDISGRFATDNGGAIPSNLLQIPNTESNSPYQRHCATVGVKPHPARFPEKLPTFFIEFLTDPGDIVLDIFAGSNTTGSAAEKLDRRWMAFEKDRTYLAASAFRFVDELAAGELVRLWSRLHSDDLPVEVNRQQRELVLMEKPTAYGKKAKRR
jgi:site-specific DNA-methyltransferase (cytosine-N4-specific)